MNMRAQAMAGLGAVVLLAAGTVWADTAPEEVAPETFAEGISVKLLRGLANIVTAPVEIPKQIVKTSRDRGAVAGVRGAAPVVGFCKGIGMTIYRVVVGAVETTLFIVPDPGFYSPMADPPFVWQGWSRSAPPPAEVAAQRQSR